MALAWLVGAVAVIYAALAPSGEASLPSRPVQGSASMSVFAPLSKVPPTPLVPRPVALGAAELRIAASARSVPVPRSFLGFSLEYFALPDFESASAHLARMLALLHPAGGGADVLRVGGDSADHVYWNVSTPAGLDDLHPRVTFLRNLGALVRRAHLKVILDLNLAAHLPYMASAFARAASRELPRASISAFEVGNEPDLYHRQGFYRFAAPRGSSLRLLSTWRHYGLGTYQSQFAAYVQALAQLPGRAPVAGPAIASPMADPGWVPALIRGQRRSLGLVTAHFYPFAACRPPRSPMYPTIPRVLGNITSTEIAGSVAPAAAAAHRAGLPFRLTEFNSVSCGGRRGVSNTFATALWAPDALFGLLRAGADGVNLHIRAHGVNAPFVLVSGGIEVRPLLYGLATFARTLGPDARLVAARLVHQRGLKLSAWSVRIRGNVLHVLLINKGQRGAAMTLRLPATAPITVERLQASAVTATSGVTFAGRRINRDARWAGHAVTTTVPRGAGGYRIDLPGYSAALLTVPVLVPRAPGTRSAARR